MRYAHRTDKNHALVRDTIRTLPGWIVWDCHHVKGWIDLEAYHCPSGLWLPIEVKSPTGKLEQSQQDLIDDGWPVRVVRATTAEEVVNFIARMLDGMEVFDV
jgi:hypothetical protein